MPARTYDEVPCTSRKWLPDPRLPTWASPRSIARSLTCPGSASGTTPKSSQRRRSRATPWPASTAYREPPSRIPFSSRRSLSCQTAPRPMPRGVARSRPSMTCRSRGPSPSRSSRRPRAAGLRTRCRTRRRPGTPRRRRPCRSRPPRRSGNRTPVHIRHRVRGTDDAGQHRDVPDLLQGLVRRGVGEQGAGREHDPPNTHRRRAVDAETVRSLLDEPHRCPRRVRASILVSSRCNASELTFLDRLHLADRQDPPWMKTAERNRPTATRTVQRSPSRHPGRSLGRRYRHLNQARRHGRNRVRPRHRPNRSAVAVRSRRPRR
jgi:hypothetical protein